MFIRTLLRSRLRIVAVATILVVAGPAHAAGVPLEFRLVRSADWPPVGRATPVLPTGRIFLYRAGSYNPSHVLQANKAQEIPPGSWVWTAEGDGFVSVVGGTINIPADLEQEKTKVIFWPVVPACKIELDPRSNWSGTERLDVVSIDENAVYPVNPTKRRELWAPAGRLLSYGTGSRGLQGIEDLGSCGQNQVLEIAPPSPPDRRHQELIITAHLPEDLKGESAEDLVVAVERPAGSPILPTAQVRVEDRVSSFFIDVPVAEDLEIAFRHPQLRSRTIALESLGGSARELPEQALRRRLDLTFEVDYRPIRRHEIAEIRLSHCGESRTLDLRAFRRCKPLEQRRTLRPGLHTYTFPNLDDGQYFSEAWIDQFVVPELGAFIRPYLSPDETVAPVQDRALLYEQEIEGSILFDGEPIPGVVSLLAIYEKYRRLPDHSFPTDDEGRYHLYYFGRQPGRFAKPPGFEDSSDPAKTLGIYGDYQLNVCTREGFCNPFSSHSVLQGAGHLDLEIGRRPRVEVRVTDAETGKPIADALVSVPAPDKALYFHHGELDWFEPLGSEGAYVRTGQNGIGRILPDAHDGRISLVIHHPEYEPVRQYFNVLRGERNRIEVALRSKSQTKSGIEMVFPDGAPVSGGFLLVNDPTRGMDARCSAEVSPRGIVPVQVDCLYGKIAALIAPGARISIFEGTSLSSFRRVTVQRAPSRPVTLRVVDEDGNPVSGVPIQLRYPDIVLGPDSFLMAATRSGYFAFYLTDEDGESKLRGVDPSAVTVPDVGVGTGKDVQWESLTAYRAGETVTLRIPGDR